VRRRSLIGFLDEISAFSLFPFLNLESHMAGVGLDEKRARILESMGVVGVRACSVSFSFGPFFLCSLFLFSHSADET
jgi:hypothetical protein